MTTPVETTTAPATTPEIAPDGSPAAIRLQRLGGLTISWNRLATTVPIYIGLVVIWLYFNSQTGGLFTGSRNLSEMAVEFSYEAVLAIGVVFVLLLGEIDLSLGYLTLLSVALTSSYSALNGWNAAVSIAVPIVVCTICGLAQGMLIAWIRMPSFVVTLGGFLVFEGIAYHILAGATINVFDPTITQIGTYYLPNWLSWAIAAAIVAGYIASAVLQQSARVRAGLRQTAPVRIVLTALGIAVAAAAVVGTMNSYRGVPCALAILAGLTGIFAFFSTRTRFGRHIYAVGGNLEAARRAGINTTAVRWIVFGMSGMMAGIAGVMLVGYSAAGSTTTAGPDLLLDVISIAVIGGVSLTGGKGSVWAVLLGGLVLASLNSGLNLMATDPYYIYVIKGAILVSAILIDVLGKRWDDLPFKNWIRSMLLATAAGGYPIDVTFERQSSYSRLYAVPLLGVLIRFVMLIPHLVAVGVVLAITEVIQLFAWIPVLTSGKYPEFAYTWSTGTVRWLTRTSAFLFGLTDEYPPFGLGGDDNYPVQVHAEYPNSPGRLYAIPLLGFLIRLVLLIPHLIALYIAQIVIGLLQLVLWVPVISSSRYPDLGFSVVGGYLRWSARLYSYMFGLTDVLPGAATRQRLQDSNVRLTA